jgi:ornithine decarboxylase
MVALRAQQWAEMLPRVKPHYGTFLRGLKNLRQLFFCVAENFCDCKHVRKQLKQSQTGSFFAAVKCNPDVEIAATLASLGVNFDCASAGELDMVTGLGVSADRIVYAHPCKPPSQLAHAMQQGCTLTVADGEEELAKIAAVAPDARVLLRIKVDDSASAMPFSAKFGADLAAVPYLMKRAAQLGVSMVGVSYHVGSGCDHLNTYSQAVAAAAHVFKIGTEAGHSMTVLNMGGGYPGDAPVDQPLHGLPMGFADVAAQMNSALAEHFPESRVDDVSGQPIQLMAEPGRYFVSACQTIATPIMAVRRSGDPAGDGMSRVYVDDGVYGSFNCIVFDHRAPMPIVLPKDFINSECGAAEHTLRTCGPVPLDARGANNGSADGSWERVSVWGPTCDSLDRIVPEMYMRAGADGSGALNQGDWLVWDAMGAYTNAAASNFNGFQGPARSYVAANAPWDFAEKLSEAQVGWLHRQAELQQRFMEVDVTGDHRGDTAQRRTAGGHLRFLRGGGSEERASTGGSWLNAMGSVDRG